MMNKDNFSISFDNQIKTTEHVVSLITQAVESGAKGITLLFGSEYISDLNELSEYLKTVDITVTGAIFPEVIYEDKYYSDGLIIVSWYEPIQVDTFREISNKNSALYTETNSNTKPENVEGYLIFIDAKAKYIEDALDALYYRNEYDYKYAGGGAGYLKNNNSPCIFTNEGIVEDALQTVSIPLNQENTVSHGWKVVSGPHLVTEAKGNRLESLDYKPIKEQYVDFIQSNIKEDISDKPFEELLRHYPIGIHHYGEELIIRDAYGYIDGAIEYMGNIPEFSSIFILTGEPEMLLNSIEDNLGTLSTDNSEGSLSIIFSCVGRRDHMGSHSDTELTKISKSLKPTKSTIGTTSLGELVTNQAGLLRLYNMSFVITRLCA